MQEARVRGEACHGRVPGSGNSRNHSKPSLFVGRHAVDEKAENAGLGRHVEKLGGDGHHKVLVRPDGAQTVLGFVQMVIILVLDVWNISKIENGCENDDDDGDGGVRNVESLTASALALGVFGIEKNAADDWTYKPADAVGGLGEIDAGGRVFRRSQNGRVGICDRFQKCESCSDCANTTEVGDKRGGC